MFCKCKPSSLYEHCQHRMMDIFSFGFVVKYSSSNFCILFLCWSSRIWMQILSFRKTVLHIYQCQYGIIFLKTFNKQNIFVKHKEMVVHFLFLLLKKLFHINNIFRPVKSQIYSFLLTLNGVENWNERIEFDGFNEKWIWLSTKFHFA